MRDFENFKSAHARMRFILSFDLTRRALSVWGSDVWGVLAANTRTSQSRYAFTTVTTANDSRDVIRNVCARSEGSPEWMGIDSWGLLQFRITRAYVLVRRLSDFLTAFTRYLRKLPLDFVLIKVPHVVPEKCDMDLLRVNFSLLLFSSLTSDHSSKRLIFMNFNYTQNMLMYTHFLPLFDHSTCKIYFEKLKTEIWNYFLIYKTKFIK